MARTILITGGAGFIGSHLVRRFVRAYPEYRIVNADALTYAGNLRNLSDVEAAPNYRFERVDICDEPAIAALFERHAITDVIHLAAESHVDRSILDPLGFVRTNVLGTAVLLHTARKAWAGSTGQHRFHHVSTDEVFGSLGETGFFTETTPYDPRSPYSASKAGSDHLVRAWYHTYGLPVVLTNCSNNYGAFQFPEKLIPLMIRNAVAENPLPVYGTGANIRDWLWVEDHCSAIDVVFHRGTLGETYAIGGHNEWRNLDLVHLLCRLIDQKLGRPEGQTAQLIRFVTDRPGHDARYAIDATRLATELGWTPSVTFEQGLSATIDWYLENADWLAEVTSGAYQSYYERQYANR
jgi:dTDP-glucose 4,6-dehydratase